ncbi:MAG: phytoene/squalene synthase family protein [Gemmatimonadetes bacterium]|nr:phytoene/squalene synthase family protein [Gemmatimonadota bacterium]
MSLPTKPEQHPFGQTACPITSTRRNQSVGDLELATLQELLVRSSRTFAVGIEILPEPLRGEITVAYLLLRVSDYLEDNQELGDDEKVVLLEEWRRVLDGSGDRDALIDRLGEAEEDTPDAFVARHAATVLEGLDRLASAAREILVRRVRESSGGMARWTQRGPVFRTEADLDDYMHEVAGRVGHLLTELFVLRLRGVGSEKKRMMALGREFGLALQTVNVIRGLHEDRDRGWVYVPIAFLPAPHIPVGELFDPANQGAAMAVLGRLVEKADRHLAAARAYIRLIPRRHHRVRLFCLLPLLFAVRTLALSRGNLNVLARETKMTRGEVEAITRRARVLGFSNRWIDRYCRRLGASVTEA